MARACKHSRVRWGFLILSILSCAHAGAAEYYVDQANAAASARAHSENIATESFAGNWDSNVQGDPIFGNANTTPAVDSTITTGTGTEVLYGVAPDVGAFEFPVGSVLPAPTNVRLLP